MRTAATMEHENGREPAEAIDVTRVGWTQPIVEAAVDRLLAGDLDPVAGDLRDVLVVMPGGRGGRLLLRDLADRVAISGRSLVPPRVVTPAVLPSLVADAAGAAPGATVAETMLAGIAAVEGAPPELLARFVGSAVVESGMSPAAVRGAARRLVALEHELAADGFTPPDAAARLRAEGRDDDALAWDAVAALAEDRRHRLDAAGLRDPALPVPDLPDGGDGRHGGIDPADLPNVILLVGLAELPATSRAALHVAAAHGTRLVAVIRGEGARAAEGEEPGDASGFDAWGCIRPAAWIGVPVVEEADLVVGEGLGDQAALAVEAMAEFVGDGPADELVVGILDPAMRRPLVVAAAAAGGVMHVAGGRPLGERPACRLLEGLARWRADRRANTLADLLRVPRFERLVAIAGSGDAGAGAELGDAIVLFDQFVRHCLPDRLDVMDHVVADDDRRGAARLAVAHRAIREADRLLAPLDQGPRPLSEWSGPLSLVIASANHDRVRGAGPDADADAEDWVRLARIADGLAAIPAPIDRTVDGVEALDLLLQFAAAETLPDRPDAEAIDGVGLLELPFDPAPAMVVVGVHDAAVPGRGRRDPLLPETLRRALGMSTDADRLGRDTYLLAAATRGRRRVRIVAGRRGAGGDPLIPSRLLLPPDPELLPARLARLVDPERVDVARPLPAPGPEPGFPVPILAGLPTPPKLRVTAFRDYLSCPYRFALAHVLGLEVVEEDPRELDAAGFGSVLHEVLEAFGRDEAAGALHGEADLRASLLDHLQRCTRDWFGSSPRSAVRLQVDRMRQRLESFARLEAAWRDEGWRIAAVEHRLEDASLRLPDGFEMPITGIVDRIDRHRDTGAWRIIDYKTGDAARSPYLAHHGSKKKPGDDVGWKDLQLPLYAHLLAGTVVDEGLPPIGGDVSLGFALLPRSANDVAWSEAAWDGGQLDSAVEEARRIVAAVRIGAYEASDRAPHFDAYPWIVQRPALLHDGAADDGEGDEDGDGDEFGEDA